MRLALALLLGTATLAWADPADDLNICQERLATIGIQVQRLAQERQQDAQQRVFYEVQLAELLAETRARLMDAQQQIEALRQELAKQSPTPSSQKKSP